jgi:phage gp36-like protein
VKEDLYTHIYPEILEEIIRNYIKSYPDMADFPAVGISGYVYADQSNNDLFRWSGTAYVPTTDPGLIVSQLIEAAIGEARSYLSRFDLLKLFGNESTAPVFTSEHLKNIVKDIACWYLVRLANPNINIELLRTNYQDAIAFLEKVMKGQADPGWPYKPDNPDTPGDESSGVQWSSNPKRRQYL